jgi:hypothetical protein
MTPLPWPPGPPPTNAQRWAYARREDKRKAARNAQAIRNCKLFAMGALFGCAIAMFSIVAVLAR